MDKQEFIKYLRVKFQESEAKLKTLQPDETPDIKDIIASTAQRSKSEMLLDLIDEISRNENTSILTQQQ